MTYSAALLEICRVLPRPIWAATLTYLMEQSNEDGIVPSSIRQLNESRREASRLDARRSIDVSPAATRRSIRALENLGLVRVLEGVDATSTGFGILVNSIDHERARELRVALGRLAGESRAFLKRFADSLERRVAPDGFLAEVAPRFRGDALDAVALLAPTFVAASERAQVSDPERSAIERAAEGVAYLPYFPERGKTARRAKGRLRWVGRVLRPHDPGRFGPSLLFTLAVSWPLWPIVRPWLERIYGPSAICLTPDGRIDQDRSSPTAVAVLALLQRAAPDGTGARADRAVVAVQAWYYYGRMYRELREGWGFSDIRSLLWRMGQGPPDGIAVENVLVRLAGYFWQGDDRRRRGVPQFVRHRSFEQILGPHGADWEHVWKVCAYDERARRRPPEPAQFLPTLRPWLAETDDDGNPLKT